MHKLSKVAAICSLLLPTSLLAQSLEGVVVDKKGTAIVGAKIELVGIGNVKTDEQGRFRFEDLKSNSPEIHISAPGFSHLTQQLDLSNSSSLPLTLTLSRSPIEVIDVVATPLHMSTMESASPVSVLAGETLRRQQAGTLGDTLEKTVGVHTNFHAKVSSTPIIRGLSGARVMIAQNGLDVSDVSRVGPDHAVATESSTAQQIEVLRGPATLFFGSGAIGGVVNVVDSRVPTDSSTQGEWLLQHSSVDDGKLASFNATSGTDNFAFYVDGFWRESSDYEVPAAPELEEELHDEHEEHSHDEHDHEEHPEHFKVLNSAEESSGLTVGASYLFNEGFVGFSVESLNREYGIPGHSHGGEDSHAHEGHAHDEHESEEHSEEDVYADLEQTRIQILSEININEKWLDKINVRAGYTDYEHAEIEHGVRGTLFENTTTELKADLLHSQINDWRGGISLHYKNSEVAAQGSEAFTPPSEEQSFAIALMEEKHFGDVLVQLGARVERVSLEAENVLLPHLEAHAHEDEHSDHSDHAHEDHAHEAHDEEFIRVFAAEHEFTPMSLSAGLVWDFTPGYNVGLSVSRSERAPSASELLSFGPHIGTRSYEVGALFALHDEGEEVHVGLSEEVIDLETANNIDLTLRKTQGDVSFVLNAFYNQVDNYYYQIATGLYAEDGHDHGHDHGAEGHDEHSGELPVYIFQTDDVILHGFEAQVAWQMTDTFKTTVFSDYVRARLEAGGDLPRTPPLRLGTQFSYINNNVTAHLDVTRYQEQDKIAPEETKTEGYTLVDASISYDLPVFDRNVALYLKANNLTDTEARVHSSFLKNIAPRPGRNIAVGLKGYF